MILNIPTASRRQPFVFGSGCSSVVVPTVSVVDTCSFPPLTGADVSPRPIIFNIPQMPMPMVSPACIDLTVKTSLRYARTNDSKQVTNRASFKTESGYDDCLEGRYALHLSLELPCVLRYLSSVTSTGSFRKDISKPIFRIKFNKDTGPNRCALKPYGRHSRWQPGLTRPISIQLALPCQRKITFSTNLNDIGCKLLSVRKSPYRPISCTYKIAIDFNGISGKITYLDAMSVRRDGIWVRYAILHFKGGVLNGVNSYRRCWDSRSVDLPVAKASNVVEKADSGMMARAPYAGGKWTKILGFTRCSNKV